MTATTDAIVLSICFSTYPYDQLGGPSKRLAIRPFPETYSSRAYPANAHIDLKGQLYDILSKRVSKKDLQSKTALKLMADIPGLKIKDARQTLTIGSADVETSRLLDVPLNAPIGIVYRSVVDRSGCLVFIGEERRHDPHRHETEIMRSGGWEFMDFRFADLDWCGAHPEIAAWHASFEVRPAAKATDVVEG